MCGEVSKADHDALAGKLQISRLSKAILSTPDMGGNKFF
jgi:hypothetical protein